MSENVNQASTSEPNVNTASDAQPFKGEQRMALVLDTTAIDGPRRHELLIDGRLRPFTFQPGVGLAMPQVIAAKFLRHDAFKLVNEHGEVIPYIRPPRQPEELQAGETLTLAENETVARFDELSTKALLQRCAERPGGEKFAEDPHRDRMIAFLISEAAAKRIKPTAPKGNGPIDGDPDAFIPEAADADETSVFDRVDAA